MISMPGNLRDPGSFWLHANSISDSTISVEQFKSLKLLPSGIPDNFPRRNAAVPQPQKQHWPNQVICVAAAAEDSRAPHPSPLL